MLGAAGRAAHGIALQLHHRRVTPETALACADGGHLGQLEVVEELSLVLIILLLPGATGGAAAVLGAGGGVECAPGE